MKRKVLYNNLGDSICLLLIILFFFACGMFFLIFGLIKSDTPEAIENVVGLTIFFESFPAMMIVELIWVGFEKIYILGIIVFVLRNYLEKK